MSPTRPPLATAEKLFTMLEREGNASETISVPIPEEKIPTDDYAAAHPEQEEMFPEKFFDTSVDSEARKRALGLPPTWQKRVQKDPSDIYDIPLTDLLTADADVAIAHRNQHAMDWRAGVFAQIMHPPEDLTPQELEQYKAREAALNRLRPKYAPGQEPPPEPTHPVEDLRAKRVQLVAMSERLHSIVAQFQLTAERSADADKLLHTAVSDYIKMCATITLISEKELALEVKYPPKKSDKYQPVESFSLQQERYFQQRFRRFAHEKGLVTRASVTKLETYASELEAEVTRLKQKCGESAP